MARRRPPVARALRERARALADLERQREAAAPTIIARGVHAVAVGLEPVVTDGALYWAAPFRYVIEQMAPRVCRWYGLEESRAEEVGEYLIAAFNDYVVALIEGFDREHFEAWIAAYHARVGDGAPSSG